MLNPHTRRINHAWDPTDLDPLWLLRLEEYYAVPDGTLLSNISGRVKLKGRDKISVDTQAGYMAWGFRESWYAPLDKQVI